MNAKELREKFAAARLREATVDIPDIGTVVVRELSLGDLDAVDFEDTADARAKNVALSIYTEDGERVFDPDSPDDVRIIKGLGNRVINQITSALSGKN